MWNKSALKQATLESLGNSLAAGETKNVAIAIMLLPPNLAAIAGAYLATQRPDRLQELLEVLN